MATCAIVDDHVMLLELLTGVVRTVPGLEVVATGTDLGDADKIAALDGLDLLIVDRILPSGDGLAIVRVVINRHPQVKCIVLAGSTIDFVCPADLAGCVVAVLDKAQACDTLLTEITRIVSPLSPATSGTMPLEEVKSLLTPREFEVFRILGEGLANKEIGQRCGISTKTVETHRKSIARKLRRSGAALIHLATVLRNAPFDRGLPSLANTEEPR